MLPERDDGRRVARDLSRGRAARRGRMSSRERCTERRELELCLGSRGAPDRAEHGSITVVLQAVDGLLGESGPGSAEGLPSGKERDEDGLGNVGAQSLEDALSGRKNLLSDPERSNQDARAALAKSRGCRCCSPVGRDHADAKGSSGDGSGHDGQEIGRERRVVFVKHRWLSSAGSTGACAREA